ncbi:MAG: hypothetical protein KAH20_01185 [Methylococcales bacterium]|nr:hypothetical protein [Methylococcales bacterium]
MSRSLILSITTAISLLLMSNCLYAAKMTFNNLRDSSFDYIENGITVSGEGEIGFSRLEGHLDDSGTSYSNYLIFSMDNPFTAIQFDISHYVLNDHYAELGIVEGFLNGRLIASARLLPPIQSAKYTMTLPDTFTGLDTLRISISDYSHLMSNTFLLPEDPNFFEIPCNPCIHFSIDNITLEPSNSRPERTPAGPVSAPVPTPISRSPSTELAL